MKWYWWLGGAAAGGALLYAGSDEEVADAPPPSIPLPPVAPNQGLLRVTYVLDLPRLAKFSDDADPSAIRNKLLQNAPGFSADIQAGCPGAPLIGTKPAVKVTASGSDRFVEMIYLATFASSSAASGAIRSFVLDCIRKTMKERSGSLRKYMKDLAVVRVS